jgi:hypothetical protein
MLLLDLLTGALSGTLLGFFRMHDEPPLLDVSVLGAAFFCVVSLFEGLHGLDLCLLNPRFRLTNCFGHPCDELDAALGKLLDVVGAVKGAIGHHVVESVHVLQMLYVPID